MKRVGWIIGGIILLAILILGYNALKTGDNSLKAIPCSDEYGEAIEKSDVTICESVTNLEGEYNYCRDNCIKEVAYKTGDSGFCELIASNSFYTSKSDTGSIKSVGSIKDMCYIHLAQMLNNISLCNNVETDWAKENCPIFLE